MHFESLRNLLDHLKEHGKLRHVAHEVDKDWEIAAITQQVMRQPRHDPAIYRRERRRQAKGSSDDLERGKVYWAGGTPPTPCATSHLVMHFYSGVDSDMLYRR